MNATSNFPLSVICNFSSSTFTCALSEAAALHFANNNARQRMRGEKTRNFKYLFLCGEEQNSSERWDCLDFSPLYLQLDEHDLLLLTRIWSDAQTQCVLFFNLLYLLRSARERRSHTLDTLMSRLMHAHNFSAHPHHNRSDHSHDVTMKAWKQKWPAIISVFSRLAPWIVVISLPFSPSRSLLPFHLSFDTSWITFLWY